MKLSLVCVSLIMLFAGCVSSDSIELSESNESDHSDSNVDLDYVGSYNFTTNGSGCESYRSTFMQKTINGTTYLFEIPVMCDQSLLPDTGYPYIQSPSPSDDWLLDNDVEFNSHI